MKKIIISSRMAAPWRWASLRAAATTTRGQAAAAAAARRQQPLRQARRRRLERPGGRQEAWIAGFQDANPDVTVSYDPVGSGGGREQFIAGGVDFAGTDSALEDDGAPDAPRSAAAARTT